MALYWIRPYEFINLDSRNRWYMLLPENMPVEFREGLGDLDTVPSGSEYLKINADCLRVLENNDYKYKNFPELSYYAWIISEEVNEENRAAAASTKGPMLVKQSVTRMFIQSIIGFIRRGMGLPSGKNFIKTALCDCP